MKRGGTVAVNGVRRGTSESQVARTRERAQRMRRRQRSKRHRLFPGRAGWALEPSHVPQSTPPTPPPHRNSAARSSEGMSLVRAARLVARGATAETRQVTQSSRAVRARRGRFAHLCGKKSVPRMTGIANGEPRGGSGDVAGAVRRRRRLPPTRFWFGRSGALRRCHGLGADTATDSAPPPFHRYLQVSCALHVDKRRGCHFGSSGPRPG